MTMTSTLQKTNVEADRPWVTTLAAPATEIPDVAGRAAQVEASLAALAPVARPLALSLDRCWRELDTGLPARSVDPEPAIATLAGDLARFGAVMRSRHAASPTPTLRDAVSADVVRAWLRGLVGARGPAGVADWRALESLAVRVRSPAERLELTGLGRTLDGVRDGRDLWVAGPVDTQGFGQWAPIGLRWLAEDGLVTLDVSVHWTRWSEPGTSEQALLVGALERLAREGWTPV